MKIQLGESHLLFRSKIFQVGESNSKILKGGVPKIELGERDLFCKMQKFSDRGVKISEVGE